ncbi:NrsF family protein [Rhizobium sp. SSA_523]|uniref:NrsF family protein n=1 Tax=Rhizobium sp. SSA_523 TaxID=2952477 RepID=UPI002091C895|nr:NrsF family protein [Rhizobium sp. SSA_523]MCO5733015.1 NrsF family protein [Rhizobium sp. SSA_523]WKC23896.1 NrsF family protein [Rhizobium sp. SSA_523]
MHTDDLINSLKADAARRAMPLDRALWIAAAGATVIAAAVFSLLLGPRPDLAAAAETLRFLFKFVVTFLLAATGFYLLRALSRPGLERPRAAVWLMAAAPLAAATDVVAELVTVSPDQWARVWWGSNITICLTSIPAIGLGPLLILLLALRHGAPTRPRLAGVTAGLVSGGLAALFYAAHCTDDSPLFVATWYSLGIAGLACLGGVLGRVGLRW